MRAGKPMEPAMRARRNKRPACNDKSMTSHISFMPSLGLAVKNRPCQLHPEPCVTELKQGYMLPFLANVYEMSNGKFVIKNDAAEAPFFL